MKKQIKSDKKLSFKVETVRVLATPELEQVAGGLTTAITCTYRPTNYCPSRKFACTTALSCGTGCQTTAA